MRHGRLVAAHLGLCGVAHERFERVETVEVGLELREALSSWPTASQLSTEAPTWCCPDVFNTYSALSRPRSIQAASQAIMNTSAAKTVTLMPPSE
jgi:hypothetical protein